MAAFISGNESVRARLAVLTIGLMLASVAAADPAEATSGERRCGDVTLIAVRGSNEAPGEGTGATPNIYAHSSGGVGEMMDGLMNDLYHVPGIPFYVEALKYPATIQPSGSDPNYLSSIAQGVQALRAEVNDLAASCPSTYIQLAGYSQGAHVVGTLLTSAGDLSPAAKSLLNGVVMFGDPTYRPGEPWDAAGNGSGYGILARKANAFPGWLRTSDSSTTPITMIRSWCVTDDLFCQTGQSMDAHTSYKNATTQADARDFLVSFLVTAE